MTNEAAPSLTGLNLPWEERLSDHNNKIEEYLQNYLFRGANPETTIVGIRSILTSTFRRVRVDDVNHPDGSRQLLLWELLNPTDGPCFVGQITVSMLTQGLALGTRRRCISCLRDFGDYVLAHPHISNGGGQTIVDKYGPIRAPFSKYDMIIHSQDRPRKKRHALSDEVLNDFYEFVRTDHLSNSSTPHLAARNFVLIVLQAETAARTSEVLTLKSSGCEADVDWEGKRVRLLGKGSHYSGKKIRWVSISDFGLQVLLSFEKVFKPMFPTTSDFSYLLLNRYGYHLSKWRFWKIFNELRDRAIEAGIQIPADLRPHDLRRTWATNFLEKNPLAYRKVLKQLGHTYPSSAAPYIIATDDDVEEQQSDLIDIFIAPYINRRRKK